MKPRKVLIVEDDAIIAMYIQRKLEDIGYEVVARARSGKDAILFTNKYFPELIIVDVILEGEMDGIQAVEQIQKKFDVPVIYLTASSDEDTIARLMETQPNGFLIKPFDDKILKSAIQIAIHRHQARKELFEAKELLRTTLDSIDDLVFSLDNNGIFTHNHSKSKKLVNDLGLKYVEHKSIQDLFQKTDAQKLLNAIKNVHETCKSEWLSVELTAHENVYRFLAKLSCRKDAHDKTLGITLVLTELANDQTDDGQDEDVKSFSKEKKKTMPGLDLSVLVVEDMSINQKVLKILLEEMDCQVSIATNGKEALSLFQESTINAFGIFGSVSYDIILMDQVMPVMDGSNAVKSLKESYKNIPPVIALTADESFLADNKYKEYGFDDCLIKPVAPAELYAKLSYWKSMNIKSIEKPGDETFLMQEIENKPVMNKGTFNMILKTGKNHGFDLKELVESFSEDMEMVQSKLVVALESKDYNALKRLVLTIKGLSGNIGASQLYTVAKFMENYIIDERYEDLKNLFPLLNRKYFLFKNKIEKEFKKHTI